MDVFMSLLFYRSWKKNYHIWYIYRPNGHLRPEPFGWPKSFRPDVSRDKSKQLGRTYEKQIYSYAVDSNGPANGLQSIFNDFFGNIKYSLVVDFEHRVYNTLSQ